MKEARQRLLYMTMTDAERKAYDAHMDDIMVQNDVLDTAKMEGRAEGRIEGRAEGRVEGRTEEKIEMAKKMKAMGMAIETISQISGLTAEQIDQL